MFGISRRFAILNTQLPNQQEKMEALKNAQAETIAIVAERRVKRALLHKVPNAANYVIRPGTEVLVYREAENSGKDLFWLPLSDTRLSQSRTNQMVQKPTSI